MDKPIMIMMIGIAGSGKSTKAKELSKEYDATIYSSDELREILFGDVNDQSHNKQLFRYIHENIKNDLINGESVIYDACNIDRKNRNAFLNSLKGVNCHKKAIFVCRPYESCIKANLERNRVIPEKVITDMFTKLHPPKYSEGFDSIDFYYPDRNEYISKRKED